MIKFSVLISVYKKEKVENFNSAIDSILNQTYKPSEIVLVKDGELYAELDKAIDIYKLNHPELLKILTIEKNGGLGFALAKGLNCCSYDLVARMDTDDICTPERFEKQINFIIKNPIYDVIGSNIEEFNNVPGDLKRLKINPEYHDELAKKIKFKSPFNHPTIMFKKSIVTKAGNYTGDLKLFEDYALFLKLWVLGARFYNLQENLLYFRVGSGLDTIKRRSGFHYLKKELKFIFYAKKIGAFSSKDFIIYILFKFPIRVLPPRIVLLIYNHFLRKQLE